MAAMSLQPGARNRRHALRALAAYALAFLVAAPCCFVPQALAAPAFAAQSQPCHDEDASTPGVACAHVASPAAVGATDLPIALAPSQPAYAIAPDFGAVPSAQRPRLPPRWPPPLAAGAVPLYLLHLHLLN
jgi:hypothetical protein